MDIAGKDYFTQAEAAHYCCLSLRQFQLVASGYGIRAVKFGGKLIYRRTDLQRAIEREWQRYGLLMESTSSTGATRTRSATATRLEKSASSRSETPNGYSSKRSSSSQPVTES